MEAKTIIEISNRIKIQVERLKDEDYAGTIDAETENNLILEDLRMNGYDFEEDAEYMDYCLKATEEEAMEYLRHRIHVALGKQEIMQEVKEKRIPEAVESFSDLHDYVDANEFCGFCHELYLLDNTTQFEDKVQTALDKWIKAGGIAEELERAGE